MYALYCHLLHCMVVGLWGCRVHAKKEGNCRASIWLWL